MERVVEPGRLGTAEEFLAAVEQALSSTEDVAALVPDTHGDGEIRDFLRVVARQLR